MIYALRIITGFFDSINTIIFFNSTLGNVREGAKKIYLFFMFLFTEIALILIEYATTGAADFNRFMILFPTSITISILQSLCWETPQLRHRIFAAFSYYIIGAISEIISAIFFFKVNSNITESSNPYIDTIIVLGSSIFIFFIVIIIATYRRRKRDKNVTIKYTLLLFITPLSTIMLLCLLPAHIFEVKEYFSIIFPGLCGLLFVNILNYYLLDNILENNEKDKRIKTIERQLSEQEEKYDQLSEAYKQTRRIIHDVKQHNNYIISCLEKGKYNDLADTLRTNIKEIEDKYVLANTGNLVIDTFINNYVATCQKYNIKFTADLTVDCDRVPIPDYDLCIIIGNLFDNCLNANNSLPTEAEKYMNVIITTRKKFLVIKINNPLLPDGCRSEKDRLYHGYGLENVKLMCEKYLGLYNVKRDEDYCTTVCIPIPQSETGLRIQRATEPGLKYDIKMLMND